MESAVFILSKIFAMARNTLSIPKEFLLRHREKFFVNKFLSAIILITLGFISHFEAFGQETVRSITEKPVARKSIDTNSQSSNNTNISIAVSETDILETINTYRNKDATQAIKLFQSKMPPVLTDVQKRKEILDNLPKTVRDLRIEDTELTERFRNFIAPILTLYGRENVYDIVIFRHKTPVFFSDTGVVLVISTGMIERAESDDELLGYTAHEIGHEYYAKYSIYSRHLLKLISEGDREQTLEKKLSEVLAIIELQCDVFAALTVLYLDLQPLAFILGIEKIGRDYPLHSLGFHPSDAVRRRLIEQILPARYLYTNPQISNSLQNLKILLKINN